MNSIELKIVSLHSFKKERPFRKKEKKKKQLQTLKIRQNKNYDLCGCKEILRALILRHLSDLNILAPIVQNRIHCKPKYSLKLKHS